MDTIPDHQTRAIIGLSSVEPIFSQVVEEFGPPPLWKRDEGFPTLIRIILEQQVSLASAKAAFDKLILAAEELTPERFLEFDDSQLKTIGFSRQKSVYGRNLSTAIVTNQLNLQNMHALSDTSVRSALTTIKGIGIWTANIYLLMAMQRPDVWPRGDIALAAAYQHLKKLKGRPNNDDMEQLSSAWSPWRSFAARLLWHYYLSHR